MNNSGVTYGIIGASLMLETYLFSLIHFVTIQHLLICNCIDELIVYYIE